MSPRTRLAALWLIAGAAAGATGCTEPDEGDFGVVDPHGCDCTELSPDDDPACALAVADEEAIAALDDEGLSPVVIDDGTTCDPPLPDTEPGPVAALCEARPRKVCSMTTAVGVRPVSSRTWVWGSSTQRPSNRAGFEAFMHMHGVRMQFRCIANTQAGVTSCGADVDIVAGGQDPVCDVPWPYKCTTKTSALQKTPAFNNGIAQITGTLAKAIGWHWRFQPSIQFTPGGHGGIGITIDTSDNWDQTYQKTEHCEAVCLDAQDRIIACPA